MLRDLVLLPGVPRRLLDDIGELRELVRALLQTEDELTQSSRSMDRKVSALDTTNRLLEQALDELRGFNTKLDGLDSRIERLEHELRLVRSEVHDIAEVVPDINRGALAKAKDALTGE